jgi:hypothetical protein
MKKLVCLALVISVIISCTKTSDPAPSTLALTNANIAGTYKTTGATITPVGSTLVFDFYTNDTYFPPCKRDDLNTFTAAGIYTYTDAGVYCTNPPAAPSSGPYTITGSDTLTFSGKKYKVETFNTTTMVIAYDSTNVGRVNLTLTKQ